MMNIKEKGRMDMEFVTVFWAQEMQTEIENHN